MKKSVLLFSILFFALFLNSEINYNLTGAGARALGMGGAFISLADDATAITWNPAGLAQLEKPEASIVTKYSGIEIEYKNPDENVLNKTSIGYLKLNFLSAVFPLKRSDNNIVLSLSVQNQMNFDNKVFDENNNYEESGSANTTNLGGSFKFNSAFSIGLTLNRWFGTYLIKNLDTNDKASYDVSGFNIGTGMLINFANTSGKLPLKLGFSYKKPFNLYLKNKSNKVTVSMPPMIGFGVSYRIGQSFTFSMDYEIRAYKNRVIKYSFQSSQDRFFYDLNQLRVGAEYLIITDFAVLPLRMGFFKDPTTYYIKNPDDSPKEQIIGNGITLGTGLIFSAFSFDIALTYSGWEVQVDNETLSKGKAALISSLIVYF